MRNGLLCLGLWLSVHGLFAQGLKQKPVWNDEFEGSSLNMKNWEIQTGTGASVGLTDWGNNEQQYYTGDNLVVKDGMLIITAKREQKGNKAFTSSRIRTFGKFSKTYGYFEARISLPTIQGLWGAFWMMPERDEYGTWAASGEIDIMESKGRIADKYSGAIHFGGQWPNNKYIWTGEYTFPANQTLEDFHVYALEWEEGVLRWYCDNVLVKEITNWNQGTESASKPFDKDFHILLNLAIGGLFDENRIPPANFTSAEMKVDYVRVYDRKPTGNETVENQSPIRISQTDGQIIIHSPQSIKAASLYSLDGQLAACIENKNIFYTTGLNKGGYILKVEDAAQNANVFKIMVK